MVHARGVALPAMARARELAGDLAAGSARSFLVGNRATAHAPGKASPVTARVRVPLPAVAVGWRFRRFLVPVG